ncbi:MAG TPA: hypothetical protein VLD40_06935 [Dissulfurispiraceae bacterium]|jgi:hypothetical protein|nr:hypothetical protein [Dissulfurispiraceae bacterium]
MEVPVDTFSSLNMPHYALLAMALIGVIALFAAMRPKINFFTGRTKGVRGIRSKRKKDEMQKET